MKSGNRDALDCGKCPNCIRRLARQSHPGEPPGVGSFRRWMLYVTRLKAQIRMLESELASAEAQRDRAIKGRDEIRKKAEELFKC